MENGREQGGTKAVCRKTRQVGKLPVDYDSRTIWIVDAHGYGNRFIVRADEILTAFVELERAIHAFAVSSIC